MARTKKEAAQELDRLQSMYRSMPDEKDAAAQQLASKIQKLQAEIEAPESAAPAKKSGGPGIVVWLLIAVVLGALAFAGAYFGGNMVQS